MNEWDDMIDQLPDWQLKTLNEMVYPRQDGKVGMALSLPKSIVDDTQYLDNAEKTVKEINRCRTANDIAHMLQEQNITGAIGFNDICPLANYVRSRAGILLSGPSRISVINKIYVVIGFDSYRHQKQERFFNISNQAHGFIQKFDHRGYPELIS